MAPQPPKLLTGGRIALPMLAAVEGIPEPLPAKLLYMELLGQGIGEFPGFLSPFKIDFLFCFKTIWVAKARPPHVNKPKGMLKPSQLKAIG